ncbi:uncharacterized protein LOC144034627 isoform X2 [Vanacampus margaritifer]
MFLKSLLLSVAVCFLVEVEPQTQIGKPLPPHNLTLRWLSNFEPQLWWGHEHLPPNCKYTVVMRTAEPNSKEESTHQTPPSCYNLAMEGGSLIFSVQTTCNHTNSDPTYLNVTYPELVSNVQCGIISSVLTRCSWVPLSSPPDFAFYYRLDNEVEDVPSGALSECSRYTLTEGVRTGCHLQSKAHESIHMLFNATLNDDLVRNTFKENLVLVTPHALKWNASKVAGKFNLSWSPPDVLRLPLWNFIINYTECDYEKVKRVQGKTWELMDRVPHCQYCMTLKANSDRGDTEWSDVKCFEADQDANVMLYAAIIIPLLCAVLAFLMCVCCRRNQEHIFNSGPKPRDLISDICNNNNNNMNEKLYNVEKEEVECQISVVTEKQQQTYATRLSHLY